jgi:hypothetical protein
VTHCVATVTVGMKQDHDRINGMSQAVGILSGQYVHTCLHKDWEDFIWAMALWKSCHLVWLCDKDCAVPSFKSTPASSIFLM